MLLAPFLSLFLGLWSSSASASTPPEPRGVSTSDLALNALPILGPAVPKVLLPGYTIRHDAPEVHLQFAISDDRGQAVRHLSRGDFQILDNQRAVTSIRDFSRSDDLPLQLGVLLDVSDSVKKSFALERQALQYVAGHLLRAQSDRIFLATFSRNAILRQPYTGNREELLQATSTIAQEGHTTYLFDCLYQMSLDQFSSDPSNVTAERVLLLISDGNDTGSVHSLEETISVAQRRGIQIYALAFHPARFTSSGDHVLKRLADATGGTFVIVNSVRDFNTISTMMDQQMRSQFAVSFQPAEPTPGFHSVQIELLGDSKFRVHARQGYFFGTP
jgi:VWFA-related protein